MSSRRDVSLALASAFLAGHWDVRAMQARAADCLDAPPPWLAALVRDVRRKIRQPPSDDRPALAHFVERWLAHVDWIPDTAPHVCHVLIDQPAMRTRRWPVRALDTPSDLADWLGISSDELAWFADVRGLQRSADDPRLEHYHRHVVRKPGGGIRVLEAPKRRLKDIQRRILREILDAIPPHDAAHGFCRHRSALTFAAAHVGRAVVVRLDLEDFFATVRAARVHAIFRAAGYPVEVAALLTGLCTTRLGARHWARIPKPELPQDRDRHWRLGNRLAAPHLPQGAPTSPALANLAALPLDARLAAAAQHAGATYTRYADDLAFSGDARFAREAARFQFFAARIALEERFAVNFHKLRLMPRSVRQHVAGVVVNERLNVPREEFDRLKALLTNCVRRGPDSQNREQAPDFRAHVLGRISWVESANPARGAKLRRLFEAVDWPRQ